MNHFNRLSPAEAERIALLMEEAAEVVQACGKILRHGYESTHPDGGPTNRQQLEKELGDMTVAKGLMLQAGDIDEDRIGNSETKKILSLRQYLHHNSYLFDEVYD